MRSSMPSLACLIPALVVCPACSDETSSSGADGGASPGAGGSSNDGGTQGADGGARQSGGAGGTQASGGATLTGGAPPASGGSSATGGAPPDGDAGSTGGAGVMDGAVGDYPDETTTGPDLSECPGGVLQRYEGSGDYRPDTNEVVRCLEFDNASIYVSQDVSSVTIEHCRFVTTRDLFLNVQGANVTIVDSAFEGAAETWIRNSYEGHHLVVRRNDFSGMGNAVEFNVGYETIEDNYIHDFGTANASQHADGLQTDGTSHAVIRHNTVLLNDVAGATGAISIFDGGDDMLIERNKVAGGGYTIYPGGPGNTNIRFLDNCFSTVFYPGEAKSGAFGPWYPSNHPPGLVRTGNTWCDGPKAGEPLDGD